MHIYFIFISACPTQIIDACHTIIISEHACCPCSMFLVTSGHGESHALVHRSGGHCRKTTLSWRRLQSAAISQFYKVVDNPNINNTLTICWGSYNEGQCGTRMINAKIYLEDVLFNNIEEKNLKQGVLKSIDWYLHRDMILHFTFQILYFKLRRKLVWNLCKFKYDDSSIIFFACQRKCSLKWTNIW